LLNLPWLLLLLLLLLLAGEGSDQGAEGRI
jgi:hypothetical protein